VQRRAVLRLHARLLASHVLPDPHRADRQPGPRAVPAPHRTAPGPIHGPGAFARGAPKLLPIFRNRCICFEIRVRRTTGAGRTLIVIGQDYDTSLLPFLPQRSPISPLHGGRRCPDDQRRGRCAGRSMQRGAGCMAAAWCTPPR